jgi:hypothetical protein
MQRAAGGRDRLGIDDAKTRKSCRKTLSASELPHSSQNRARVGHPPVWVGHSCPTP